MLPLRTQRQVSATSAVKSFYRRGREENLAKGAEKRQTIYFAVAALGKLFA
jgi:hypothetical protein